MLQNPWRLYETGWKLKSLALLNCLDVLAFLIKVHEVGTGYLRVVQSVCSFPSETDLVIHWLE